MRASSGRGMLSAAVCGDVFASPSVDAVLAGILAVTGSAGCLLVVKNYAGDRLNFGLAAERARALGHRVETVIVSDDIALPDAKQPRGVAGTLFVHKVAGHAAENGASLETVAALARRAAAAAKSLGIAVSTCTIPGSPRSERLAEGQAELGLGIHGEPGVERITLPPASELARMMADRLSHSVTGDRLALLVNNLGSASALEMQILTRAVLATDLGKRVRLLIGPAPLMTALDMHGASLSILPLDDDLEAALMEPVPLPAWPGAVRIVAPTLRPMPGGLAGEAFTPSQDPVTAARIAAVAQALIAAEDTLNALDAKVGDGDAGTTFAGAARAVLADLDRLPQADPAALCGRWPSGSDGRWADRAGCWARSSSQRPRPRSRKVTLGRQPWRRAWRGSRAMAARSRATAPCSTRSSRRSRLWPPAISTQRPERPAPAPRLRHGWIGPAPAAPATSRPATLRGCRTPARPASLKPSRPWRRRNVPARELRLTPGQPRPTQARCAPA